MESLVKPLYRLLALIVMAYAGIVSLAHAATEHADVTGGRVKGEVSNGLATYASTSFTYSFGLENKRTIVALASVLVEIS